MLTNLAVLSISVSTKTCLNTTDGSPPQAASPSNTVLSLLYNTEKISVGRHKIYSRYKIQNNTFCGQHKLTRCICIIPYPHKHDTKYKTKLFWDQQFTILSFFEMFTVPWSPPPNVLVTTDLTWPAPRPARPWCWCPRGQRWPTHAANDPPCHHYHHYLSLLSILTWPAARFPPPPRSPGAWGFPGPRTHPLPLS